MSKDYISASGLKTHASCPAKWEFRYLTDKEPVETDTRYMDLGTAVHDALEFYCDIGVSVKRSHALEQFDIAAEREGVPDEMIDDGRRYVEKGIDYFQDKDPDVLGAEVEHIYEINTPSVQTEVRATMDLATENEVWDWKTGSIRDETPRNETLQGMVYAGAYADRWGEAPSKVRFIYLKEGEVRQIPPTEERWGQMLDEARRRLHSEEYDAKPGDRCYWCPYEKYCPDSPAGVSSSFSWEDFTRL